jgi:hypothetical protein
MKGLPLPIGAVEAQHQVLPKPLPQRMLRHQSLQLSDQLTVMAQGQLGLDPLLLSSEPELLQRRNVGLGKWLIGEVGQSRAAPQVKRGAKKSHGLVGLGSLGVGHETAEPVGVDLGRLHREDIAGMPG